MRRLKLKTGMLLILSAVLFLTGCTSGEKKSQDADTRTKMAQRQKAWKEAETSPLGKYPETVTYTLGQMKGTGNSNLPEGETYENNAYTRYLKKILNVQNKNIFMESEEGYDEALNILVKDRNLPDIFLVSDRETLEELVENDLIEDLTDVYKSCASDRIREMYESYGDELLESGTFDGKLLALPETAIDHGVPIQFDETAMTPYFRYWQYGIQHEVWFEDVRSLKAKFDLIKEYGLSGAGYWQIMNFFRANWLLLADMFEINKVKK